MQEFTQDGIDFESRWIARLIDLGHEITVDEALDKEEAVDARITSLAQGKKARCVVDAQATLRRDRPQKMGHFLSTRAIKPGVIHAYVEFEPGTTPEEAGTLFSTIVAQLQTQKVSPGRPPVFGVRIGGKARARIFDPYEKLAQLKRRDRDPGYRNRFVQGRIASYAPGGFTIRSGDKEHFAVFQEVEAPFDRRRLRNAGALNKCLGLSVLFVPEGPYASDVRIPDTGPLAPYKDRA